MMISIQGVHEEIALFHTLYAVDLIYLRWSVKMLFLRTISIACSHMLRTFGSQPIRMPMSNIQANYHDIITNLFGNTNCLQNVLPLPSNYNLPFLRICRLPRQQMYNDCFLNTILPLLKKDIYLLAHLPNTYVVKRHFISNFQNIFETRLPMIVFQSAIEHQALCYIPSCSAFILHQRANKLPLPIYNC